MTTNLVTSAIAVLVLGGAAVFWIRGISSLRRRDSGQRLRGGLTLNDFLAVSLPLVAVMVMEVEEFIDSWRQCQPQPTIMVVVPLAVLCIFTGAAVAFIVLVRHRAEAPAGRIQRLLGLAYGSPVLGLSLGMFIYIRMASVTCG